MTLTTLITFLLSTILAVFGSSSPSLQSDILIPSIMVENLSIDVGEQITFPVDLEDMEGNGLSGFDIEVSLSNSNVEIVTATINTANFPLNKLTTSTQLVTVSGVDLFDNISTTTFDVELVALTVKGFSTGETVVSVSVTRIDDDDGFPIQVTSLDASFTVVSLSPVLEDWTATTRVYQDNVDAFKRRLETSIGAFNYKAAWKGVTDWTPITAGFVPAVSPWDYKSTGALYDVRVKEDLTAGQIIEWEIDGHVVSMQPHNLQWTNDLDQIELISIPQTTASFFSQNNRQVGWNNAYGTGRNLSWTLTNSSLHKILEFSSQLPAPSQFIIDGGNPMVALQFIFNADNDLDIFIDGVEWDKKKSQSGNLAEFRFESTTLFGFKTPIAEDANNDEQLGSMEFKKQGNSLFVIAKISKSFFDTATFPVRFDPTISEEISTSFDDGMERNDLAMNRAHSNLRFGVVTGTWHRVETIFDCGGSCGFQGDTIDNAQLEFLAAATDTGTFNGNWWTDATASPPTLDSNAGNISSRATSTTSVSGNSEDFGVWTEAVTSTFSGLEPVIQYLADNFDSDRIGLIWSLIEDGNNGERVARSFDSGLSNPKLTINFTEAGEAPSGERRRPTLITKKHIHKPEEIAA